MHPDELLLQLVLVLLTALLFGWVLDRLHQPPVLGYILAGLFLGNIGTTATESRQAISLLGEIGLVLLLFFIGSEVRIRELLRDWKTSVLGTVLQILGSIGLCVAIGLATGWDLPRSVFFGMVISLSSTAVVLKILEEVGGTDSPAGRVSLGILLVQDFALVPLLILLGFLGKEGGDWFVLLRQTIGAVVFIGIAVFVTMRGGFSLPKWLRMDGRRDFQLFAGLIFSLGAALLAGVFGLSPALGAFLAGMVIGSSEEGNKMRSALEPFKMLFVSVFFISVGLLFDLDLVLNNILLILFLVFLVLVVNTAFNTVLLRLLGLGRDKALIVGCLLGQIGELSFLLAGKAMSMEVIDMRTYRLTLSVISLTLLFTPIWLSIVRRLMRVRYGVSGTMALKVIDKDFLPNKRDS